MIKQDEVGWIEAAGHSCVRIHAGRQIYTWRRTLKELEATIDQATFIRVHRSAIVNSRHIRQVKPLQKGEYALILTDGSVIDSGRTRRDAVEQLLRIDRTDRTH